MPPHRTVKIARKLRKTMSLPEVKLWAFLRSRPSGLRFRRQHPIGRCVLDFYCPSARLAIEIDGMAHDMGGQPQRDMDRDIWLAQQGMTTLRIPAEDVLERLDAVCVMILDRCVFPLHHPADGPPPHASHGEDA